MWSRQSRISSVIKIKIRSRSSLIHLPSQAFKIAWTTQRTHRSSLRTQQSRSSSVSDVLNDRLISFCPRSHLPGMKTWLRIKNKGRLHPKHSRTSSSSQWELRPSQARCKHLYHLSLSWVRKISRRIRNKWSLTSTKVVTRVTRASSWACREFRRTVLCRCQTPSRQQIRATWMVSNLKSLCHRAYLRCYRRRRSVLHVK